MKTKNRTSKTRFHDAFRVEPLEPRVLLSADPVLAPLATALLPHHQQAPSDIHLAVKALGTHATTTQPLVHSAYVTTPVAAAPATTPVAPAANAQAYVDAGTLVSHESVLNTAVSLRTAHIQSVTSVTTINQTPGSNLTIDEMLQVVRDRDGTHGTPPQHNNACRVPSPPDSDRTIRPKAAGIG